jgi:N-acetylmuramoyl-L-alanine amidase
MTFGAHATSGEKPMSVNNRLRLAHLLLGAILFAGCLGAKSACAAPPPPLSPVALFVGGRDVSDTVVAYHIADETYASLEVLKVVGVTGKIDSREETIKITTPASSLPSEVAITRLRGRTMLALSDFARVINAHIARPSNYNGEEESVHLLAKITRVTVQEGALQITSSFPVPYRVRMLKNDATPRGFVDCYGAIADRELEPSIAPSWGKHLQRVRLGQNDIDVARVVVEFKSNFVFKTLDQDTNSLCLITTNFTQETPSTLDERDEPPQKPKDRIQRPGRLENSQNRDEEMAQPRPASYLPKPPAKRPAPARGGAKRGNTSPSPSRGGSPRRDNSVLTQISGIYATELDDKQLRIEMVTSSPVVPRIRFVKDSSLLYIDLPNAYLKLEQARQAEQKLDAPFVSGLRAYLLDEVPPITRVALKTDNPLRYRSQWQDNILRIDLRLPEARSGALGGKTVFIDPGHGGNSSGATAVENGVPVYEKDITLAISLKLKMALEALGATVYIARESDSSVALYERPAMANRIGADYFISVHNDSSRSSNSASGTSTYYHKGNGKARALAQFIQQAIVAVSGLPSRGALSDGILYQNGLAVLRASNMTAVLVEVAYINNDRDRKHLLDPDFQDRVATAIAEGLRLFIENGEPYEGGNILEDRTRKAPTEPEVKPEPEPEPEVPEPDGKAKDKGDEEPHEP